MLSPRKIMTMRKPSGTACVGTSPCPQLMGFYGMEEEMILWSTTAADKTEVLLPDTKRKHGSDIYAEIYVHLTDN